MSHPRGSDVAAPAQNKWAQFAGQRLGTFSVHVFDGVRLPLESDASYDTVVFNMVLHHAASHAPGLLREAARLARHTIVLLEDADVRDVAEDEAQRRLALAIFGRHMRHDPRGVFRTQQEWCVCRQPGLVLHLSW